MVGMKPLLSFLEILLEFEHHLDFEVRLSEDARSFQLDYKKWIDF